jgi:prefoldin subunit 5
MENELSTARELATHAADIAHLQEGVDKLTKDVDEIKKALADIQRTLSEAKGGWRVLMLIGGAGGAFGAALTHFLHIGGPK